MSKRIFFGHQSVGENILDGIRTIAPSILVQHGNTPSIDLKSPVICHLKIGQNGNPRSKIDEFVDFLSASSERFDFAALKLCYVDITHQSNVTELHNYYVRRTSELSSMLPQTELIHVTTPLLSLKPGLRTIAMRLLQRPINALEENLKRHEYNELLRQSFGGQKRLFDLARLESTWPDGRNCEICYRGTRVPNLCPNYTSDGGHLNKSGQLYIGKEMLLALGLQASK